MAQRPDPIDRTAGNPLYEARATLERVVLPQPSTVIIGTSGGADSLCLALVLSKLAPEFNLQLVAAHYDHGIRDIASRTDERNTVIQQAKALNLKLCVGSAADGELHAQQRITGSSLEDLAREKRYAFLFGVAANNEAYAVAVGHHLDDNLETILMRALQGSLKGGGIPKQNGLVLRPLIDVRRAEIDDFVQSSGLPFMQDPTNTDQNILRNRIRKLLPRIESAVPGTARNLPLLAGRTATAWRYVEAHARKSVPWCYRSDHHWGIHYSVTADDFWNAPDLVRQEALYKVYDAIANKGEIGRHVRTRLPRRFIEPLLKKRPSRGVFHLTGHGISIICDPERVRVVRQI